MRDPDDAEDEFADIRSQQLSPAALANEAISRDMVAADYRTSIHLAYEAGRAHAESRAEAGG